MPNPTTFSQWWTGAGQPDITINNATTINWINSAASVELVQDHPEEEQVNEIPIELLNEDHEMLIDPDKIIPNKHTYGDIYKYPVLRQTKTAANAYEKALGKIQDPYTFADESALIGIEIEVENITNSSLPILCYWQMKNDGSLRNNGFEFVSIPLRTDQIQYAVKHIRNVLLNSNNPKFTNRTSVHIHLNCRDMTPDQLWNLVILYSIFEKHFYKFAGTRRLNSIFCVPIYRTNILSRLDSIIYRMTPFWYKYCGLNLLPMVPNDTTGCYGTVEFRHLFGTLDEKELYDWINGILSLRKAAMSFSKEQLLKEISAMNTNSSYIYWYNSIFQNVPKLLIEKEDFEECISNVKKEIWGNQYFQTITRSDKCKYWELYHQLVNEGAM